MAEKIRVAILGYGNLGRGVELAIRQNDDMCLTAFFTRRDPSSLKTLSSDVKVYNISELESKKDEIDVLILCSGSAKDLPEQSPKYAEYFNIVDSFDTHAKIPEHFTACDESAKKGGKVALISAGWDPGMFSIMRLFGNCIIPNGKDYTFWGKGVSQGHSDAIRRIDGVLDAKQYTVPVDSAIEAVRSGENPELTVRQKHTRECFVVAKEGADLKRIEEEIKTMPNYFADYDTTVHFITAEEMKNEHSGMPHGGFVIRTGNTGEKGETKQKIEYSLSLGSNPEFTASVIVAYALAVYKLNKEGAKGAKTVFDIPPVYLSPLDRSEIIKNLL